MNYQLKILNHPADLRIEVEASSLEDLFKGAVEGMASFLYKKKSQASKQFSLKRNIEIKSNTLEHLLIDSLNEILALVDINNAVFPYCEVTSISDNQFKATLKGYSVDHFDSEIKAATYYGLKIEKYDNKFRTIITFDI